MSAADDGSSLRRGPMLLIGATGVIAFIAMLVLGAYAPNLRSGNNGGTHALSTSGTGFSGIMRLAFATGRRPSVIRNDRQFRSESLLVVSPDNGQANLDTILSNRGSRITLVILPKWRAKADPNHSGWVTVEGLLPPSVTESVLSPAWLLKVTHHKTVGEALVPTGPAVAFDRDLVVPQVAQSISGKAVIPVLSDGRGHIILGQLGNRPLYVLADPDLLNNHGLRSGPQAAAALRLLDSLNSTGAEGLLFDVTANGLGQSRSPLRLAFDPPFLAVTITLFAAMLLAGWQMLIRFGAPLPGQRALAFGKSALVDNCAAMIRRAGRETRLGASYADVLGRRAATLFRLPSGLDPGARDELLDRLFKRQSFSLLAADAASARSRPELVAAAQSLHDWIKEVQE